MNNNECNKYEWYFTTKSEEEFQEHLNECPVCRRIHETMLKAGQCVKEVSEVYLKRRKKHVTAMKAVACVLTIFVFFGGFMGYELYSSYSFQVNSLDNSVISEMGLPVDEYGFLSI